MIVETLSNTSSCFSNTNQVTFYSVDKVRKQAAHYGLADVSHSCALLEYGAVKCWGRNNYGQLGGGGMFDFAVKFE